MLGQNSKKGLLGLFKFEEIFESLSKLIETKIRLAMLDIEEKSVNILSNIISGVLMGIFLLIFLFFLNFTIAFYLNHVLDSEYLGFAIISGFYLLLFIILMLVRKKIMFKDIILKAIEDQNHSNHGEQQRS